MNFQETIVGELGNGTQVHEDSEKIRWILEFLLKNQAGNGAE